MNAYPIRETALRYVPIPMGAIFAHVPLDILSLETG